MSKQGATITGIKGLGYQLRGNAPVDSKKLIKKGELNAWYYVDNAAAGITAYPDNRVICYEDVIGATFVKPAIPFYQYDVTRSGIPGAIDRYFTYIGPDFQTNTIVQNEYGYVGRFCMQENSYMNNSYGVYTFSLVGVCYPYYGAYPQPYLTGCCLYFNNLGSYTVSDVKIYQMINVDNLKQNFTTVIGGVSFLAAVPGVNILWGAASLLVIIGGVLYGQGSHLSNQLRYTGTGNYTNGAACLDVVGSSLGTPQYYIAYKVKNPQGSVVASFGYGTNESAPPGLTSSCVGSGTGTSTAAVWTDTGTTACVSCAGVAVFRDTNTFSTTAGKYKVGANGTVVTNDPTSACNTAVNYSTVWGYTYSCSGGVVSSTTVYKNSNPCFSGNQYQIGTTTYAADPSETAPTTSANWVYQYQNCSACVTRNVERDMNPCSATYLGYTVNHGLNVGTTAPTNTGACSTTQVWTDNGTTRCNGCTSEKQQTQTNPCATGSGTTRWVAGGSACNTTANYNVYLGEQWTCNGEGGKSSQSVYQNSTACFSGDQFKMGTTTYATQPTVNAEPSVDQNWVNNGAAICQNTWDLYQPQIQNNPCAPGYNTTRTVLIEQNSPSCGYAPAQASVVTSCACNSDGCGSITVSNPFNGSGDGYTASITTPSGQTSYFTFSAGNPINYDYRTNGGYTVVIYDTRLNQQGSIYQPNISCNSSGGGGVGGGEELV